MDYPVKTLSQLRPILTAFRKAAGMTQAKMASHLGVTQQTYAQLESNPASASLERLFKVLRVLNVELTLSQTETATEIAGTVKASSRRGDPAGSTDAQVMPPPPKAPGQAPLRISTTAKRYKKPPADAPVPKDTPTAVTKRGSGAVRSPQRTAGITKRENW